MTLTPYYPLIDPKPISHRFGIVVRLVGGRLVVGLVVDRLVVARPIVAGLVVVSLVVE